MTVTVVAVLGVVAVAAWVLARYNALVRLRTRLDHAWSQLDLQLQRRHEVVADLVGELPVERREDVSGVLGRARGAASADPVERASVEADLVAALSRLMAVSASTFA